MSLGLCAESLKRREGKGATYYRSRHTVDRTAEESGRKVAAVAAASHREVVDKTGSGTHTCHPGNHQEHQGEVGLGQNHEQC